MVRHSKGSWVLLISVVLAAGAASALFKTNMPQQLDWVALLMLVVGGAVAFHFPIQSSAGATYNMTNVFLIAGAVILPHPLLVLLPVLVITPASWLGRNNPGAVYRWLFNVAQTTVAVQAASFWVHWSGTLQLGLVTDLAQLLVAALIFILIQDILVGLALSIDTQTPVLHSGLFSRAALLGEGFVGVLGAVVGALWMAKPSLLLIVPPMLFVAHQMTRGAHLAHLAEVDTKTGLHNYRHYEKVLAEEVARSQKVRRPLAILFADLDMLRTLNNHYGHLAGDQVIRQVSRLMTDTLRKGDLIARFGGEEFVALLSGTDVEEALYLADQIRQAVERHRFVLDDGTQLRCTISVGVATCPEDAADASGLLKAADKALYKAKETRNAVARAGQTPLPRLELPAAGPQTPAERTSEPAGRPKLATLLLVGMGLAAVTLNVSSLVWVSRTDSWLSLLPFLILICGAEFLRVPVYEENRQRMEFTLGIVVVLATITLVPQAAPLVSLTGSATAVFGILKLRKWDKILFNLSNTPLAAAAASAVYMLIHPDRTSFSLLNLAAAAVAVLVFDLVNYGLVSLIISLHTRQPLAQVLKGSSWYTPTKLFLGLTGAFLGGAYTQLGWTGLLMFTVPVLIMWYTLDLYAKKSQQTIGILEAAKTEVEQAHRHQEETLRSLIETVASVIDARDKSLNGHSRQVAKYAVSIGQEMGLNATELAVIQTAGLLHDLGKIGIPEVILHKPARLTPEEYETIKRHTTIGETILGEVRQLQEVARMVGEHHEYYDGQGYPRGKRGEQISQGGRIISVADALDSMLSDRPYSKAKPLDVALAELNRCSGTQFDPHVVAALHRLAEQKGPEFFVNSAETVVSGRIYEEVASD